MEKGQGESENETLALDAALLLLCCCYVERGGGGAESKKKRKRGAGCVRVVPRGIGRSLRRHAFLLRSLSPRPFLPRPRFPHHIASFVSLFLLVSPSLVSIFFHSQHPLYLSSSSYIRPGIENWIVMLLSVASESRCQMPVTWLRITRATSRFQRRNTQSYRLILSSGILLFVNDTGR